MFGRNRGSGVCRSRYERKITVIGEIHPVVLVRKLRKLGCEAELLSMGPAKPEKFKAKKGEKVGSAKQEKFEAPTVVYMSKTIAEKKVGSKCDTENMGSNHYLGVQRAEAVGGFGRMNRAIEDKEGSEKRIVEVVAGFGDFTSIEVDIKKGMVTVVGKSVPVSVALKVREMGYRAKLLSLGPTTEEEDTDEQHNDDLYPDSIVYDSNLYEDPIVEDVCTITCFYLVVSVLIYLVLSVFIIYFFLFYEDSIFEDVEDFCTITCFSLVLSVLILYVKICFLPVLGVL